MASKSIQTKKKELLDSLELRRLSINDKAENVQGALKQIPTGVMSKTEKLRNITPNLKGTSSTSVMDKVKKLSSKVKGLSSNRHKVKGSESLFLPAKTSSSFPTDLPIKPIVIGLGSLLILGVLMGGSKKKKKSTEKKILAQAKENNQVAKFGFGILILKWLLGASQPAVKHMITKKVKNRILG